MAASISPLSVICAHLHSIVETSMRFQAVLRQSEAATRAVLVDPLLKALGWDAADLNRLEIEKIKNNMRVDYLLKKPDEQVFAVVEAKCLGCQLNTPDLKRQIINYQNTFFTKEVWLTDGLQWQFYDTYDPNREPYCVNLNRDDLTKAAQYFLFHLDVMCAWPHRIDNVQDTVLLERLRVMEERICHLENAGHANSDHAVTVSVPQLPVRTSPSLANGDWQEMKNCGSVTGKKLVAVRLPDGTELSVEYWNAVLKAVAEYFIAKKPDVPIPFYDSDRKKMVLIGYDNSQFKASKPLDHQPNGRTLYLNTNYSANATIAKCLYLVNFLSPEHRLVEPAIQLR